MNEKLQKYEEKMESALKHLNKELASIRAGRANPAILDKVTVDYYGTPTPINQIAAVSVAEARVLAISPWDASMMGAIERAILTSDIGINPTNDGRVMRLVFPAPTEERRRGSPPRPHCGRAPPPACERRHALGRRGKSGSAEHSPRCH